MKANLYAVVSRAVLDGIEEGLTDANKRTPSPMLQETLASAIEQTHRAVMREIVEYVKFETNE